MVGAFDTEASVFVGGSHCWVDATAGLSVPVGTSLGWREGGNAGGIFAVCSGTVGYDEGAFENVGDADCCVTYISFVNVGATV